MPNNKAVPFKRVDPNKVEVDPRLTDNSFDAKVNALKFENPRQLYVITSEQIYLMCLVP